MKSINMELRHPMRIGAGLVIIAISLFVLFNPVFAKGPESVTITGPGIETSINFMDNNNIDLEVKLMEETGLWYGTGTPLTSGVIKAESSPTYTLTWVNSGPPSMTVKERTIIQHIYLDAELGPIIHTPPQDSLKNWGGRNDWMVCILRRLGADPGQNRRP